MKLEDLVNKFRENYSGNNLEYTLEVLKNNGASQMESLKIIKNELDISMKEADLIILNSIAWTNEKEVTLQLRDNLFETLEKLHEEE